MTRPRLKNIDVLPNYVLKVTFIDDTMYHVKFKHLFSESPGLAPLENPAVFEKATIVPEEGWTVEWPELDIQIGADTLLLDAQAQAAVTTAQSLWTSPKNYQENPGHLSGFNAVSAG